MAPSRPMSVLIADDDPLVLRGLQRSLRSARPSWTVRAVQSVDHALRLLAEAPADVCVSDLTMADGGGLALLQAVADRWPRTVRVILSGHPPDSAAAVAQVAHRMYLKGSSTQALIEDIDSAVASRLVDPVLQGLVSGSNHLPVAPSVFPALEQALREDATTTRDLTQIVARDPAIAARVLQLASSAFFGLPRKNRSLEGAVSWLGIQNLRSIVLTVELFEIFVDVPAGLSPTRLANHGLKTGQLALRIARDVCPAAADIAFMAGIVHDVGVLLLATRDPDQLSADMVEMKRRGTTLHEVEVRRGGVGHGAIGAALLALWGLDPEVVRAVRLHHQAPEARGQGIDAAGAVYVANRLVSEVATHGGDPLLPIEVPSVAPARLERWRALAGNP